jgi:Stress responsive A/B Barrel Domain
MSITTLRFHSAKLLLPAIIFTGVLLLSTVIPADPADEKLLRHVVLFKFTDRTTPEQIKQVEDAFRALPSKINFIRGFEWGTNVSPENLNQGYTHCFFLTFVSDKDRDAYLVHSAHKEFGKILTPYLDKVTVVDFWAQK